MNTDSSVQDSAPKTEQQIDEAIQETFPASDPPAIPTANTATQDQAPAVIASDGVPDDRPYPFPTAEHHPDPDAVA